MFFENWRVVSLAAGLENFKGKVGIEKYKGSIKTGEDRIILRA
jgi:hypothetical protein